MLLIAMRLADMHRIHPKQDNSHVCSLCGETVGIYPSGQAGLRRFPELVIVCEICRPPSALWPPTPEVIAESLESKPRKDNR
jgi:hypothetical protein